MRIFARIKRAIIQRAWRCMVWLLGRRVTHVVLAAIVLILLIASQITSLREYYTQIAGLFSDAHTLISELWPLPKANPDLFTVALVRLDNDQKGPNGKGEMEYIIVNDLEEIKGIGVLELSRPPIPYGDLKGADRLASKYLTQSGAQILIWGNVISIPGKSVSKLHLTACNKECPGMVSRYALSDDLNLPPLFVTDLANVICLVVGTQSAAFSSESGHFTKELAPFIQRAKQLLATAGSPSWSAENLSEIRVLADALTVSGDQRGSDEQQGGSCNIHAGTRGVRVRAALTAVGEDPK
jgi:hypothetical protein